MRLHTKEWGSGDRVALLLHGFMGSAESWWRVGPALAQAGFRVLALDLPGHGQSPPDPDLTVDRARQHVVETVQAMVEHIDLAIGHSYGGLLLSAAIDDLAPNAAVYVDSPFSVTHEDPESSRAYYETAVASRTVEHLRHDRPSWSERDRQVEERAARAFDVDSAVALDAAPDGTWLPRTPPRSLLIRAAPSRYVSDDEVVALQNRGLAVTSIPDAAHAVWYSHFDEFMRAIGDWLPIEPGTGHPEDVS